MLYRIIFLVLLFWPVSAWAFLTDTAVHPETTTPTLAAAGATGTDPVFGSTILRLTDASDSAQNCQTVYSNSPALNFNSTKIMGLCTVSYNRFKVWDFAPTTMTRSNPRIQANPPTGFQDYQSYWSHNTYNKFYGCARRKLYEVTIPDGGSTTWTNTIVKDFAAIVGGAEAATDYCTQISLSDNDDVFAFHYVLNSAVTGFIAYRRSTDTVLLHVVGGGGSPTLLDEVEIDKSGRYLVVCCSPSRVYDLQATPITNTAVTTESFVHRALGSGFMVSGCTSSRLCRRSLATPNTITYYLVTIPRVNTDFHLSLRGPDAWVMTCRFHTNGEAIVNFGDDECLEVSTSTPSPGSVRRHAHHHSNVWAGDYEASSKGNISQDGQFACWTSNWNGPTTATRNDVYCAKIVGTPPPDTTPPTQVIGLTVTPSAGANALNWPATQDAGGVVGHNIKRWTSGTCATAPILTTVGNVLTYTNTGLSPSTTYNYCVNSFDGATPSNQGIYSAAVAGATPATYRNVLAFEDFNIADGPDIGTRFDAGYTGLQAHKIVSQRVLPVLLSNSSVESYNAVSPNDQWIQATLSVYVPASTATGLLVRTANAPTFNTYECRIAAPGTTAEIVEWSAGTVLVTQPVSVWAQGDQARCEAEGTALRFYRSRSGAEMLVASTTDATLATGKVGLKNFETTDLTRSQFDNVIIGGFSATPDVAPSVTAATADATGANVTSAGSPTTIRVATNQSSVVEPIANFPGGRYTRTWIIGDTTVSFFARDLTGTENQTAFATVSLVGVAPVADTTPPVISDCKPTATQPAGTTSVEVSCATNEPAVCYLNTADEAYDHVDAVTMAIATGLRHTSTVTGLTDSSVTPFYVRCQDQVNGVPTNVNTVSTTFNVTIAAAPGDVTAPSTVTNLVSTALSQTQAALIWTPATDAGGIAGYQVFLSNDACVTYNLSALPVAATHTLTGLAPNTPYCATVRAVDTAGNVSAAQSNVTTFTTLQSVDVTPPSAPSGLTIAATFTHALQLRWTAGTDAVSAVTTTFERCTPAPCSDWAPAGNVGVNTTTFTMTGLSPGTSYSIRALHTDQAGNRSVSYSNTATGSTTTAGLGRPRLTTPRSTPSLSRGQRS